MKNRPGKAPWCVVTSLLMVLAECGCNRPEADLTQERRAKAEASALKILQEVYGLPSPPLSVISILKPDPKGPGHFNLVIKEPGWELEGAVEAVQVKVSMTSQESVFDWEMPAERVASHDDAPGSAPLLLHLRKGADHRPLIIPTRATRRRPGEKALFYSGAALGGGLLIISAPVWLPSFLILQPMANAEDKGRVAHLTFPLPGVEAPACYPDKSVMLATITRDASGVPNLRITLGPQANWSPTTPTPLAIVRKAFACFQPELAPEIMEDTDHPDTFLLPLTRGEVEKGRPILLLHRNGSTGTPEGKLWALYFPPSASWVKAWLLYPDETMTTKPATNPPAQKPAVTPPSVDTRAE